MFVLAALTTATGQMNHAQMDHAHQHQRIGYVPREIMNRPLPLRTGIGSFHEPVTTSPEAQRFYDQGQSYLHSYMWIEAARSFHQALRLDPKLAMAYVGLSYAYSPMDYTAAGDAVAHALKLAQNANDRERALIEIRQRQLDAMLGPQNSEKLRVFRQAIDDALARYPNDPQLLLLRGNAEEPSPFGDGQGCVRSAIPYYSKVLEVSANNFAAHHYLAHCYENVGMITEAIPHAEAYARLAPEIAHAQHMLGHELRRSGRTTEAIVQFRKADEIERKYYLREKIPGFLDWHHAHNLALLANCYQSTGQMKNAEKALRGEISLPAFTDYAMLNRSNWPVFLLTRDRFTEAQTAAEAMQKLPSPLAQAAGYALAGQAALSLALRKKAEADLQEAQAILLRLSATDAAAARTYVDLLSVELQTSFGAGSQELRNAIARIQSSANPDAWAQGLFQLELLASFARRAGDWDMAETIAHAMIGHDPQYAGGHFALALVAEHRSNVKFAREEFVAAARLWSEADRDLPELIYAGSRRDPSAKSPG
jgi:tetratricopeptide (TPR) repeat protein